MSTESNRTLEAVIHAGDELSRISSWLQERTAPCVVMFVDLVGSTEMKATLPQDQWLVLICRFLFLTTQQIGAERGRVIKYIGDEVMAIFEDASTGLAANRAESCVIECEAALKGLPGTVRAKYALDYGECATVDFEHAPGDVLGAAVDRCARISKLAEPGTAVASEAFVAESKRPSGWRKLGEFPFKGLSDFVSVFQFQGIGAPMEVVHPELLTRSSKSLVTDLLAAQADVERCREEIRMFRSK